MATFDDPRVLRAIAHPTRNRVLHEVAAAGSLRAADVARRIDIPANQASFHLRQLAKYGLVEEDPDAARDRRDRVWRLVDPDGLRFRTADVLARPGGREAYAVFRRNAVEWGRHLLERALTPSEDGERGRSVSEWALLLTPAEAAELMEEVAAVVERRRRAAQGPGAGGAGDERRTYSVFQVIQPYPEMPADAPADDPAEDS